MSQPQPPSLPALRTRAIEVGQRETLREASVIIDDLVSEVGRKNARKWTADFALVMTGFILGIFLCAVHGCAMTIGHVKVPGWPELAVYEHYVPHHVMRDKCVQYTPAGYSPEACSEFNLDTKRCDIYFSADFPPPAWMVRHERMHCEGYDHVGETHMRDFLRQYTAAR